MDGLSEVWTVRLRRPVATWFCMHMDSSKRFIHSCYVEVISKCMHKRFLTDRFENPRSILTDTGRWEHAQAPSQHTSFIRQDVPKEIGCDNGIKEFWIP